MLTAILQRGACAGKLAHYLISETDIKRVAITDPYKGRKSHDEIPWKVNNFVGNHDLSCWPALLC